MGRKKRIEKEGGNNGGAHLQNLFADKEEGHTDIKFGKRGKAVLKIRNRGKKLAISGGLDDLRRIAVRPLQGGKEGLRIREREAQRRSTGGR